MVKYCCGLCKKPEEEKEIELSELDPEIQNIKEEEVTTMAETADNCIKGLLDATMDDDGEVEFIEDFDEKTFMEEN